MGAGYTPRRMDKPVRDLFLKLRKARKLNQDDIEAKTGVSQGLISRIEKDAGYQPTTDVFFRAVGGLDVLLSDFFLQVEQKDRVQGSFVTYPVRPEGDKQSPTPEAIDHGPAVPSTVHLARAISIIEQAAAIIEADRTRPTPARSSGKGAGPHGKKPEGRKPRA